MAEAAVAPDQAFEPILEFAALSAAFEPSRALSGLDVAEPDQVVQLASRLALLCDTHPIEGEEKWLMLTPERRKVLNRLRAEGRINKAIAARRLLGTDAATESLLLAIAGDAPFGLGEAETLALKTSPPRGLIEDMVLALDRAGDAAPAYGALPLLRSALARLDHQARFEDLKRRGVVLRPVQRSQIDSWLERRFTSSPIQMLYAAGAPGVGKSILLESSVQAASAQVPPILVRLDFDRAGLDVLDELGLTTEVARQVANQAGLSGRSLLNDRLRSASLVSRSEESASAQRRAFPFQLAAAIGKTVAEAGREVLVVLDTLEALRSRGDTHPPALFRWLDRLVDSGLAPVRVLGAGRDDTLPSGPNEPDRVGVLVEVDPLDAGSAAAFMEQLGVPPALRADLARIAEGNPLLLRVAASVVGEGAIGAHQEGELADAYLYRILLSRIDDPLLKALLRPGLVIRSVSAAALREVIAPALRLPPLSKDEAKRLFGLLANHTWLVERDPFDADSLQMRPRMRAVLLPLLYRSMKVECARLDDKASRWFARREGPWAQVQATYHRLQLMRARRKAPLGITVEMALGIDDRMMEELPAQAQDLIRGLRGDRTSQLRSGSVEPTGMDEEKVVNELMAIVERRDWVEGQYAARQLTGGTAIDPRSRSADALRAFWWRSGRWGQARAWMIERERLADEDEGLGPLDLPPALGLVRLEMEAEFAPVRLLRRLQDDPSLAGHAMDMALRSPDEVGRRGALAFLTAAATDEGFSRRARQRDGDVVAAAFVFAAETGIDPDGEMRGALGEAQERMQARGAIGTDCEFSPQSVARLFAVLTPYATLAVNLSHDPDFEWVAQWAAAADAKLASAGGLLPWAAELQQESREHPILGLARLGLFAEWSQAAALFHRSADLRLIGRSAEAWRRTVAGEWRYGARPRGWRSCPIDATMRYRLDSLFACADPAEAALAQLGLWSPEPDPDGERVWASIRDRRHAPVHPDPVKRMRSWLGRRLPSAFVPGAAVLGSGG